MRNIEYVQNVQWFDETQTVLNCDVKFDENEFLVPYTVSDSETNPERILIWEEAVATTIDDYSSPDVDVDDIKQQSKYNIDVYAGYIRQKFITTSPGQEMTYQEKADQAADFVAAGYPTDVSNYPFIQAEMDAMEKTKEQAADDILLQRAAWISAGAMIERHRLTGKRQVNSATTINEIQTIVAETIALLDAV